MTKGIGDDGTPLGADPEIDEKPVYIASVKKVELQERDTQGDKVLSVDCEQLEVFSTIKDV